MRLPLVCVLVLGGAAGAMLTHGATSANRDFSRYQPIVDRLPFGGANTPAGGVSQPGFATRFTLVGMVSSNYPAGALQAILLDKSAQNKTYFRAEGETIDGVKIIKINDELPNRSVVLQQGLETATLIYEARRTTPPRLGAPLPGVLLPPGAPAPNPEEAVPAVPAPSVPETGTGTTPPRRIPFRR
jgi:hypothetical protein